MRKIRELIFCLTLLFISSNLFAQQKPPLVSGQFNDTTVIYFLEQVEQQTGYHLYYDTSQFDMIRVNIILNNDSIQVALEKGLRNTGISFSIDDQKNVFINKGLAVQTKLPDNFFYTEKTKPAASAYDTSLINFRDSNIKAENATLENKIYKIGDAYSANGSGKYTMAGYIKDAKTGEPVVGASVYTENKTIGASTDNYGYFAISLPKGRHTIYVQSIGMRDTKREIQIEGDGKINIEMQPEVMTLKRVIVSAEKLSNVKGLQMGVQKIDIKAIKQVPVIFGESDILRAVLTMPGVKSVGEASTGLNVRGGSADQNLILFNDATIYNPSHFFGLFSAFNPEVVKDVELFKSSIPAKYGGRLSSVLEITSREGNKKELSGTAGIGLLTSRINLEGPLVKDKSSFILGARSTYADWLLNILPQQYKNSKAGFYDVNLDINHEINKKNTIYFTGYLSHDRFNLNSDTSYSYGNQNISVKWKHIFNNKVFSLISAGNDHYNYEISSDKNPINAYVLSFDINQTYFKAHVNYFINSKHTAEFGFNTLYYKLHPGDYVPVGKESLVATDNVPAEQALESAVYASDKYTINSKFAVEAGIRLSMYNYLGAHSIYNYPDGAPKTVENIIDTSYYSGGKVIKTYGGPEVRLSARYQLSQDLSLKAGYNSQRQYIHVLSNTAAIAPTDIWKLSDSHIKPQYGDQVSFGVYKNFKSNTIETSVEVYYKRIKDYLDYKSGAVLVLNHHIETDVINTKGKAYGVEVLIKKSTGKLNGWLSYTYSRILLKVDDPTSGEIINGGNFYPSNYDEPHSATLVGNFKFTHRFSISINGTYSTGRPITLPIGRFYYEGAERTLYADRNAYRIPDYFRTDFAMNIDGNHKVHQAFHTSWTIGVYNFTARKNPYSVYFISENGVVTGYKLSIFGTAIPYVNFNIRFR